MMIKTLSVIIFIALAAWPTSAGVRVIDSNDDGIVLEFTCPRPQIEKTKAGGQEYAHISIKGCLAMTEPGKPALPLEGVMLLVPPNTIPELVSTETSASAEYRAVPAPALDVFSKRGNTPDVSIYKGEKEYPNNIVSVSSASRAGLYKVAFVSFHPLRFNPVMQKLYFTDRIKIHIRYRPAKSGESDVPAGKISGLKAAANQPVLKNAVNQDQAAKWISRPAGAKAGKSQAWPDTLPYKILVENEGIYKIGYYDLVNAGITPAWSDPRSYKLYNEGREIPIYFKGQADGVFDQDDYFEFYGQRVKGDSSYYHPYSRDNVYWLSMGGSFGARMIEENGSPTNPNIITPRSYHYKMHLEKDSLFYRLSSGQSDQTDRWFWRRIDESDSMVLNIPLPDYDPSSTDSVTLRIQFHGYSSLDIPGPDHWALIVLNRNLVLTANGDQIQWDGQTSYLFDAKIDPSYIVAGNNRLVLKHGPLDTLDSYFLNWIGIEYPRLYSASGGRINFNSPVDMADSLLRFTVNGFEDQAIEVYKIGVSKIAGAQIERDPAGMNYQLSFDDRSSLPSRYFAVQDDGQHKLKPKAIIKNHAPSPALTDNTQAAEYIIIASDSLWNEALRLASQRSIQYNSVKVISVTNIFDAFNFGIAQDKAIRDFLSYAYSNWQSPPSFVLLLGGGSWDPRNLLGHSRADFVPVHLTRTDNFGPVADDNYYSCLAGNDILPDIAVGRIPVSTAEDYRMWEAKQVAYDQHPYLDQWQRDFLLIAGREANQLLPDGRPNPDYIPFYAPSNELAASLNPRYVVSKVYHSNPATTKDLIDQFNEGAVLAGYYGHGGGQVWSHDSFFRIDEVAMLNNWGRWPLVGSFTCYSGAFDIPDTISLSQALLHKIPGGAIGVYASSGPSWENVLEQTFFGAVNYFAFQRFGDIINSSKYELSARNGGATGTTAEMISSYNLLGDPGMTLSIPRADISITITPASVLPGDSTGVTITGGFKAGSVTLLSLCDSVGNPAASFSLFSDSAGKVAARVQVPASMDTGKALMKAFVKDADSSWAACGEMGINQPVFYGITASPSRPVNIVDSIDIVSGASNLGGIDSVWCEWRTDDHRYDTFPLQSTLMDSLCPGFFKLRTKIINAGPSDTVLNYRICLSGPGVVKETSKWNHHHLLTRSDLSPRGKKNSNDNSYFGGKRRLTLYADIYNIGETRADSIPIHFYRYNNELPPTDSFVVFLYSILPGAKAVAAVPWTMDPGKERDSIKLSIDPWATSQPPEQDTSNNHFASNYYDLPRYPDTKVYRQLGLLGSGDTVTLFKYPVRYFLPDSSLNDSAVAVVGCDSITQISALNPSRQPGLRLIGDLNLAAYFVVLTDSSRALLNNKKLWLSMNWPQLSTVSDLSLVNLYRYNYRQGLWQKVPGGADSSRAWGTCDSMGLFIPMIGTDTTAPLITASLDKQATGWGTEIRVPRPQYSVLIEDQNGINLDSVWVKKDGVLVPRNEYNLPAQPQDHTSIPLAYAPYLTDGLHSLEFGACDNLGNSSSVTVQSMVEVGFGLDALACYPTPIDGDYATFYFFVGDHADQYELKIYTVAGRLIKTFKGGSASGVKTMRWDVDDDSGQKVANGVYFYTLEVWSESGERQKKTEKLAVLR